MYMDHVHKIEKQELEAIASACLLYEFYLRLAWKTTAVWVSDTLY